MVPKSDAQTLCFTVSNRLCPKSEICVFGKVDLRQQIQRYSDVDSDEKSLELLDRKSDAQTLCFPVSNRLREKVEFHFFAKVDLRQQIQRYSEVNRDEKSQNDHMLKSVPWLQPYWCFCGPKMTKWAHVDLRQQKQRYLRGQKGKVVKKR